MALFSRRRRTEAEQPDSTTNPTGESVPESVEEAAATPAAPATPPTPAAPAAPAERDPARGPWDVSQADDRPGRVDLGAIRIPGRDGMALRMELDRATRRVIAANVTLGKSTIQLQAFAAPRARPASGTRSAIRSPRRSRPRVGRPRRVRDRSAPNCSPCFR